MFREVPAIVTAKRTSFLQWIKFSAELDDVLKKDLRCKEIITRVLPDLN